METELNKKEELSDIDKLYGKMIDITIYNLYSLTKNNNKYYIEDFDINNKQHLFFLECCLNFNKLYNKEVSLKANLYNKIKLKKKYKKQISFYKTLKEDNCSLSIERILTFEAAGQCCNLELFELIYDEYYRGEKW